MKLILTVLLTIFLTTIKAGAEDKLFWTLAGGAQVATIFDVQTTMRALKRCPSCSEANPIMRPFIGSPSAAFSASLALSTGSIYGSYKLRQRGTRWWWLPLAGQIGIHTAMGVRNSRLR